MVRRSKRDKIFKAMYTRFWSTTRDKVLKGAVIEGPQPKEPKESKLSKGWMRSKKQSGQNVRLDVTVILVLGFDSQ